MPDTIANEENIMQDNTIVPFQVRLPKQLVTNLRILAHRESIERGGEDDVTWAMLLREAGERLVAERTASR